MVNYHYHEKKGNYPVIPIHGTVLCCLSLGWGIKGLGKDTDGQGEQKF